MTSVPLMPAGQHQLRSIATLAVSVALAYYIGVRLGLALRFPPATTSVLWPPNAVLTAALVIVPVKDVVQVYYQFRNEEKAGLGMPMPSGVVRVYQADSKGGVQFVGEDRINHTPKDETLKLKIGNAFDVICERNQTDFRKDLLDHSRGRIRDCPAQPQGHARDCRSERTDRRHVDDAALVT